MNKEIEELIDTELYRALWIGERFYTHEHLYEGEVIGKEGRVHTLCFLVPEEEVYTEDRLQKLGSNPNMKTIKKWYRGMY